MVTKTFEAIYDGQVLRPTEPLELPPNTAVRITIETSKGKRSKKKSFLEVIESLGVEAPPDWSENIEEYLLSNNLLAFGLSQDEIQRRVSEWLVFSLFSEGRISSGKAGKLLGLTRLEFIELLKNRGIAFINYNDSQLREELEVIKDVAKTRQLPK